MFYYGDYSGTPEHNTTLLECITAEVGQKAKITWINEQVNDEIIPANYLVRSEKEAYDGILGFTGEYFINNNLTGEPDLIRQDLSLSLIPSKDKQLKKYQQLSARWQSTLTPPNSGNYTFTFSGSGNIKLFINDSIVINKTNNKIKESFNLPLNKDKKYNIKIECKAINVQSPVELSWRPPFSTQKETPETIAENSDLVILFLRDDNSSEGRDRKNLHLHNSQEELINKVTKANPNTILLISSGTAISLKNIVQNRKRY